jgi:7-cyano-7-deazaguanine tRNA-ribosyltransferase
VVVKDDAIPFNREGKNVFCAFVGECDPDVRPMDEVMVVDGSDNLVALGRALLTREEMFAFRTGIAVKVREGIKL